MYLCQIKSNSFISDKKWNKNLFFLSKRFLMLFFIITCFYGCTAALTKPVPPPAPSLFLGKSMPDNISLPQITPKPALRYKSISENPILSGNIVANVEVQSENNNKIIKQIICDSPSGKKVRFEPVSTYFILSITNKSERIFSLGRTIIQIEDDKANEFPIPSDIGKLIREMLSDVNEYYDKYKTGVGYEEVEQKYKNLIDEVQLNDKIISNHKKYIFGEYKEKFDSYKSLHSLNSFLEIFNPFTYIAFFLSDGKSSIHENFDKSLSPGNVWFRHSDSFNDDKLNLERNIYDGQNQLLLATRNRIDRLCRECQEKIKGSLKKNAKMIFTSGDFKPIPILPQKTIHIIIPINQWDINEAPDILYCKIYDIVTVTDDASNPIKRDNLSFTFQRLAHNFQIESEKNSQTVPKDSDQNNSDKLISPISAISGDHLVKKILPVAQSKKSVEISSFSDQKQNSKDSSMQNKKEKIDDELEKELVLSNITNWAVAWSNKDFDQYLSFYSIDFKPKSNASRQQWAKNRKKRFNKPYIKVIISDPEVEFLNPTVANVTFNQYYKTKGYQETSRKQLKLAKEVEGWKILHEETVE